MLQHRADNCLRPFSHACQLLQRLFKTNVHRNVSVALLLRYKIQGIKHAAA
jgi:hypothetical protein